MPVVGRRSRVLAEDEFPDIVWEHSHVVVDDTGKVRTFCVYAAPSEEIVREHSSRLGQHRARLDRGDRRRCHAGGLSGRLTSDR